MDYSLILPPARPPSQFLCPAAPMCVESTAPAHTNQLLLQNITITIAAAADISIHDAEGRWSRSASAPHVNIGTSTSYHTPAFTTLSVNVRVLPNFCSTDLAALESIIAAFAISSLANIDCRIADRADQTVIDSVLYH